MGSLERRQQNERCWTSLHQVWARALLDYSKEFLYNPSSAALSLEIYFIALPRFIYILAILRVHGHVG